MSSTKEILNKIADPALTHDERAQLRCHLAKTLETTGNYEAAREAMNGLWFHIGERPLLNDLEPATAAEVLLRAGVLTGWIGSIKQVKGSQGIAKDLIGESLRKFEAFEDKKKVAEARMELGLCYWREGAFDEARILLTNSLIHLGDKDNELKAIILLRSAMIEAVSLKLRAGCKIKSR